ncbi:multicopper oxidase [Thermobispora bispora]|uniref:multicopper oxidase domain-containing protein n=1 Tax=Thermobispora bispora TaxID=2006 RepID=UPI0030E88D66
MTREPRRRRGFSPLRDLPVMGWLTALIVVVIAHPFLPAPKWLMLHLLLLGALSHSILVWSRHFADALLRTPERDPTAQRIRLGLHNGGALLVIAGVATDLLPLTAVGAASVAAAALWHGAALVARLRTALPSRFSITVRFYVAASCFLPIGALLGTLLARGFTEVWHERLKLAHAIVNLLGWAGLTVVGTLLTLWPAMLRTRMAEGAERATRRALPLLTAGIVTAAGGAIAGARPLVALGLAGYLAGLGVTAVPMARAAKGKPPASYATWSVLAAVAWLAGSLAVLVAVVAVTPTWPAIGDRFSGITPALAAGFGAQVLLGALSYLVPVALGRGAGPVRVAADTLDRAAAFRVVIVNAGLLVSVLPVPVLVRVLCSFLVFGGLGAFLPLLIIAIRRSRAARRAAGAPAPGDGAAAAQGAAGSPGDRLRRPAAGLAVAGLAVVVLAVASGVALDPGAVSKARAAAEASAEVRATGRTVTARVEARDMRFSPATIEVSPGDRLVITLVNTDDEDVHDLVLDTGQETGRLAPGESARIDVGVVGRDIEGWCSVLGHRQMGMVLHIRATGAGSAPAGGHQHGHGTAGPSGASGDHTAGASGHGSSGASGGGAPGGSGDGAPREDAAARLDFTARPGPGFTPYDPVLRPASEQRLHRYTFRVQEVEREVAPGVTQRLWTFNGQMPGPVLHGKVGDTFEITLVNDGTIGHSIDFHAGSLAPDKPMRTIPPGESLVYRFTATKAGVWMYHCSTMPMSAHIANGLFGAVIIEPEDLPAVDRSYVLVQSELYLGPPGGEADMDKIRAERPDAVVFNGYVNQYDHRPLAARAGERVRVWLLAAGPNRGTSFHVVGGQFDTVYAEGAYLLRPPGDGGSQSLALAPAQGGFVELVFPEPGHYPFVSHAMVDAERGAHGIFKVTE